MNSAVYHGYQQEIKQTKINHGVIHPNDTNGKANSEDPDQTAPVGAVAV